MSKLHTQIEETIEKLTLALEHEDVPAENKPEIVAQIEMLKSVLPSS